MKRLFFCLLLFYVATINAQQPSVEETGSFTALEAGGARAIRVRIFFSRPFKPMPEPSCFAEIVKPRLPTNTGHGVGELQEHSLMWVQIYAEVGEQVTWTCRGQR